MKTSSNKHLRRTILCAIFAGIVAAPFAAPHAYALPIEGANAATNAGEANISTGGAVMDIVGKTEHNILKWEDFSIEQNEKVRFDGGSQTRDYLNLVTGEGASNIYGTIEGGRNVYLVNPHGILFAEGSQVNTGALYLSTANVDAVASAAGTSWGGNSPLSASTQYGNVLNLGTVQTAKLYIEGKNVKVLNTDAVTDGNGAALTGSAVTIRSAETPHIGYDVGNRATANFDEGGGSVSHSFYDYANPNTAKSASARGWDVTNLGGTAHTDYDYMRVHDVYDLQNINAKRDGRYILAGDIDATATTHWNGGKGFAPLGYGANKFTGRLDGAGHMLRGLYINRQVALKTGLFGTVKGATIENFSLRDGNVQGGDVVGGIVGYAKGAVIRNVSYAGRVDGMRKVGGIVGEVSGGSIQNVWNAGAITGNEKVGGIAGYTWSTTLQNAWNTGTVTGSRKVGGIVGEADGGSIRHAVSKTGSAGQAVGSSISGADVTTDVKVASEADMKLAATYTDWKDANGTALVATEGGKGTPWRIYEGHTMPLLTALMKGTKRLAKVYDGNVFATTDPHITLVHTGKDVGTYDAYSDQFGYDLIGGAVIKPRVLTMSGVAAQSKTYDGTTAADISKFHATLNNVVSGEESLVTATATGATYNSKDVRAANTVNYTGVALGGTGAGNYTLAASTAQGAGGITAKQLNLALTSGARFDKTYDGNANVTQTLTKGTNYSLTGFIGTEGTGIALASSTGTYSDKNAAANKTVTFNGLTLTGTGAGNYTLDKTAFTGIGTIAPRALTLGAVAAQTKTYDGTTAADASKFGAVLNNAIAGDKVTATATGAAYNSKNVAAASTIDYTGVALSGAEAGNYSLAATTAQGTGTISRRALTIGTVTAQSKTYDGTTAADTSKFHATLGNLVTGEESSVTATAGGATYNSKDVRAANTVGYTGVQLTGTGAGNYSIANTAQGAGRITPKQLTLDLTSGARFDKTYDGNNRVEQSLAKGTNYSLTGFITGEGTDIELSAVTGKYADKNAAADKAVTFDGLTLTGTGAGNYVLNKTALTGTGTITPRALTLGTVTAQTKTYDGTRAADTSKFHTALNNAVAGDSVTAAATGATYNDKNVAAANRIDYTGVALRGADAGNYTLAETAAQGAGTITPRDLTLTADAQSIVQGEALPSFTGHAEGFADGEDERVFGADGLTFESTVKNTETPGSYGVIGKAGGVTDGVLGNYRIRQAEGNTTAFTIHAAALPGGLLASLVQDAAPRFDFGFGDTVYLYGTARPIRAATLGLYRFDAKTDLENRGMRL